MCDKKPVLVSSFLLHFSSVSALVCLLVSLATLAHSFLLHFLLMFPFFYLLASLSILAQKFFVQLPLFVVLMDHEHMFLVPVLLCLVSRLFTGVRSM